MLLLVDGFDARLQRSFHGRKDVEALFSAPKNASSSGGSLGKAWASTVEVLSTNKGYQVVMVEEM